MIDLIDTKRFSMDIMYRPRCIGFGINIGNNYLIHGKMKNIFIEIDLLFWILGVEVNWK